MSWTIHTHTYIYISSHRSGTRRPPRLDRRTFFYHPLSKTRIIHGSKHHPLERDDDVVVFRPPANANAGRVRERSVREETRAAAAAAAAARETPRGRGMHRYRCRFPFDTQNALRSFVRVSVTVFFSSQMLSLVSRTLHPPRLNHRRYTDGRKTRDCTF